MLNKRKLRSHMPPASALISSRDRRSLPPLCFSNYTGLGTTHLSLSETAVVATWNGTLLAILRDVSLVPIRLKEVI